MSEPPDPDTDQNDYRRHVAYLHEDLTEHGKGLYDGEINHHHKGRGFYFRDSDRHVWKVITHTYVTD